jgi:VIT1/CCC1 family predicted Fe2+/Mn2+ transporter
MDALYVSVAFTLTALFLFGFIKGRVVGVNPWKSALEMTATGALASGAAYGIGKAIPQEDLASMFVS